MSGYQDFKLRAPSEAAAKDGATAALPFGFLLITDDRE